MGGLDIRADFMGIRCEAVDCINLAQQVAALVN
jgi:hypothetical protein